MTANERVERYADELINRAMRIVGAVHSDSPEVVRSMISEALSVPAPPGTDPVMALAVTLAAMVDHDKQASELLRWTKPLAEYRRLLSAGVSEPTAALLADHLREAAA